MDEADASELRARAERYRRLQRGIDDARALEALNAMAKECDDRAEAADQEVASQNQSHPLTRD